MNRSTVLFFLMLLPLAAEAAESVEELTPGVPYYYDNFNPDLRLWKPGKHLNLEEVFKNYQYYEVVLGADGKKLTVISYIRGSMVSSAVYRLLPDGSLLSNDH